MRVALLGFWMGAAVAGSVAAGEPARLTAPPLVIAVAPLPSAPVIDGDAGEWPEGNWIAVPVTPAVTGDRLNFVGDAVVRLQAGVVGGIFHLVAQWRDDAADTAYKPFVWQGARYGRDASRLDDGLAVRFAIDGDYDACMISDKSYRVDMWEWTAGRSNGAGIAADGWHEITMKMLNDAVEVQHPDGRTVYIRKRGDDGTGPFGFERPGRQNVGEMIPSVRLPSAPAGSAADVAARGQWRDGVWTVEMSRALDTGHDDDAAFVSGATLDGAIAVFNRADDEHKSVSGVLRFSFP